MSEAILTEKPNVHWSDIAGLEMAKQALKEAVELPICFPDIFQGARKPWKGILLYGPPGTGKTYLAKACATEFNCTFFSVSSADLISKWVGESEKLIKSLFRIAREKKPSIIFIDEVDSLTGNRSDGENEASRRVKTEFLVQMQGVGNDDIGVLVLGATNIPWGLDPAIRRRFEKRIYIALPDEHGREALLRNILLKTPNLIQEDEYKELANRTDGMSGADLSILLRDAAYQPLRKCQNAVVFKKIKSQLDGKERFIPTYPDDPEGKSMGIKDIPPGMLELPPVCFQDFLEALTKTKPSVSKEDQIRHIEFTKNFGAEG